MAVTKNQLEYQIKLETQNAEKNVDALTASTYRLRDAAGKYATPAQIQLYHSLAKTRQELDAQASSGKDVSDQYDKLAKDTEALNSSLGLTSDVSGGISSNFNVISNAVSNVTQGFSSLVNILDTFTDPAKTKRFADILVLLSMVAKFKGFGETANSLKQASGAVDTYTDSLVKAGLAEQSLSEKMSGYADNIRTTYNTLGFIGDAIETTFLGVAGAALLSPKPLKDMTAAFAVTSNAITQMNTQIKFAKIETGGLSSAILRVGSQEAVKSFSKISDLLLSFKIGFGNAQAANLGFIQSILVGARSVYPSFNGLTTFLKDYGDAFKNIVTDSSGAFSALKKGALSTGTVFNSHLKASFLNTVEASGILSSGLAGVGAVLTNFDSTILKVSGTLLLVAGILTGGFAYAIKYAMGFIGSMFTSIANYLETTMSSFVEKFQKAQISMVNFAFTMEGFGREFGMAIGSVDEWNMAISDMSANTLITATDSRKMATEIIQVGVSLGLTKDQMLALNRLIPDYVKAGEDAYDVTVGFLQALTGMGQSVIKYGLHVSDAVVEHSKYFKELNLNLATLTESQKAEARLATIMEQAAAVRGRASEQLNTVAGAQQYLNNQLIRAQELMGSQNFLIQKMYVGLAKLTTIFTNLPAEIWYFVGTMQDALTVSMKLLGVIFSYALPVGALISLYGILSATIANVGVVQTALTWIFAKTSAVLGVTSIAVTSLNAVWLNLALTIKGIVFYTFASLKTMFLTATSAAYAFTAALLTNPLFWKAAAIGAAIYFVYSAIKKLEIETGFLSEGLKGLKVMISPILSIFGEFSGSTLSLGKVFSSVMAWITDGFVTVVGTILTGVYQILSSITTLAASFTSMFSDSMAGDLNTFSASLNSISGSLYKSTAKAADNFFTFSSSASAAGDAVKSTTDDFDAVVKGLKGLNNELVSATEKKLIFAQAMGTEGEILSLSKALAEEAKAIAKTADEKKSVAKELIQIDANMLKLSTDYQKETAKKRNEISIAELETVQTTAAIVKKYKIKLADELKSYKEQLKSLSFLPQTENVQMAAEEIKQTIAAISKQSRDQQIKDIEAVEKRQEESLTKIKEIYATPQQKLAIDVKKQTEDLQQLAKDYPALWLDVADKLADIDQQYFADLHKLRLADVKDVAGLLDNSLALAEINYEEQLVKYKDMLKEKRISDEEYNKITKKLDEQMLDAEQEDIGRKAATFDVGRDVKKVSNIMTGFSKGLADSLLPITNIMSASNAVVGQVQALIDFVPQILNSVANIFSSLADLPLKILEGVVNLIGSIAKLFSTILPNIVKAVLGIFNAQLIITLVNALVDFISQIPSVIIQLIDGIIANLPDIIDALITAVPRIAIALLKAIIIGIPQVIWAMVKMVPQITMALINGFISAFKSIGKMVANLFSGKSITEGMGKGIEKLKETSVKALTGVSNALFGLIDVGAQQKAGSVAASLQAATDRSINFVKQAWNWLIDKLGMAWNGLMQAGQWVIDKLGVVWGGFTAAGQWVYDLIVSSLGLVATGLGVVMGGITTAFEWVNTNILLPFFTGLVQAFTWVWDNILSPAVDLLMLPFKFLWDSILVPLKNIFLVDIPNAFKGMFSGIATFFKGLFTFDWEAMKNGFAGIFSSIGDFIIIPIKAIINPIIDMINGIKLPKFAFTIPNPFGDDKDVVVWNERDLIPGNIARFATGGFVPQGTDTVPAMLTPGEFVINRSAAQSLGAPLLQQLNRGKTSSGSGTINVTLNIKTEQPIDEAFVKNKLMPQIKNELRRASLDGNRVLATSGVR